MIAPGAAAAWRTGLLAECTSASDHTDFPVRVLKKYVFPVLRDTCFCHPGGSSSPAGALVAIFAGELWSRLFASRRVHPPSAPICSGFTKTTNDRRLDSECPRLAHTLRSLTMDELNKCVRSLLGQLEVQAAHVKRLCSQPHVNPITHDKSTLNRVRVSHGTRTSTLPLVYPLLCRKRFLVYGGIWLHFVANKMRKMPTTEKRRHNLRRQVANVYALAKPRRATHMLCRTGARSPT